MNLVAPPTPKSQAEEIEIFIGHRKLVYVQWLRAFAASGIVFLHAHMEAERFSTASPIISSSHAEIGRYGVDLFFVISGFVIYYTNYPNALPSSSFLWKRIQRIVPIYWVLTTLAFALRQLLPVAGFVSPIPTLSTLVLTLAFLSGHSPIIGAGWTLEYEAFFYVTTALAIAVFGVRWSLTAYLFIMLVLLGVFLPNPAGPIQQFMDPLLLEFVFGLIAAELYCTGHLPRMKLLAVTVAIISAWYHRPVVIWVGLPSAVVVYGAAWLSTCNLDNVAPKIFGNLGSASYSIYLCQFFTLPIIGRAFYSLFGDQAPNLLLLTAFLGTIASGYGCYLWLERPLQRIVGYWPSTKSSTAGIRSDQELARVR